jgi:hypothetical protein
MSNHENFPFNKVIDAAALHKEIEALGLPGFRGLAVHDADFDLLVGTADAEGNLTPRALTAQERTQVQVKLDQHNGEARTLDRVRAENKWYARQKMEAIRAKTITVEPGKIQEYNLKREEYDRWVRAGKLDPPVGDYPIAAAERMEFRPVKTLAQMLQTFGDKDAEWRTAVASIAARERRVLVDLDTATTEAEMVSLLTALQNEI